KTLLRIFLSKVDAIMRCWNTATLFPVKPLSLEFPQTVHLEVVEGRSPCGLYISMYRSVIGCRGKTLGNLSIFAEVPTLRLCFTSERSMECQREFPSSSVTVSSLAGGSSTIQLSDAREQLDIEDTHHIEDLAVDTIHPLYH